VSTDVTFEELAAIVASFDQPVSTAGHSSGAICVLGAALRGIPMVALVLDEPP
jgi:hypothetical protein